MLNNIKHSVLFINPIPHCLSKRIKLAGLIRNKMICLNTIEIKPISVVYDCDHDP